MKKVHTEEQIVGILRGYEASGVTVAEFCRTKGIHETTFYNWKKRFGTMEVEEVRQLRTLTAENARLKRLLAERDLEIDIVKEVLKKSGRPRGGTRSGGADDRCRDERAKGVWLS